MLDKQIQRNRDTHIEFRDGIFIRVPGRDNVEVVRKGYGSPPAGKFKVIRPLVNFFIKDPSLEPEEDFPGPLQLLVRFTQDDLDIAADLGGRLVFAFIGGKDKDWVKLDPDDPEVNGTRHQFFDGFGGYDEIILESWPADPANAWGV